MPNNLDTLTEFLSYLLIKRNGIMHNINALLSSSDITTSLHEKLDREFGELISYDDKIEQAKAFILKIQKSILEEEVSSKEKEK